MSSKLPTSNRFLVSRLQAAKQTEDVEKQTPTADADSTSTIKESDSCLKCSTPFEIGSLRIGERVYDWNSDRNREEINEIRYWCVSCFRLPANQMPSMNQPQHQQNQNSLNSRRPQRNSAKRANIAVRFEGFTNLPEADKQLIEQIAESNYSSPVENSHKRKRAAKTQEIQRNAGIEENDQENGDDDDCDEKIFLFDSAIPISPISIRSEFENSKFLGQRIVIQPGAEFNFLDEITENSNNSNQSKDTECIFVSLTPGKCGFHSSSNMNSDSLVALSVADEWETGKIFHRTKSSWNGIINLLNKPIEFICIQFPIPGNS